MTGRKHGVMAARRARHEQHALLCHHDPPGCSERTAPRYKADSGSDRRILARIRSEVSVEAVGCSPCGGVKAVVRPLTFARHWCSLSVGLRNRYRPSVMAIDARRNPQSGRTSGRSTPFPSFGVSSCPSCCTSRRSEGRSLRCLTGSTRFRRFVNVFRSLKSQVKHRKDLRSYGENRAEFPHASWCPKSRPTGENE